VPNLTVAATTVRSDEPAFLLTEGNFNIPFTDGEVHRIQKILVVRGDRLAIWKDDLGDAGKWPDATPLAIPGGQIDEHGRGECWETVGSLREIAEAHRHRTRTDIVNLWEYDDPTPDWETMYHTEREKRDEQATGRIVVPT